MLLRFLLGNIVPRLFQDAASLFLDLLTGQKPERNRILMENNNWFFYGFQYSLTVNSFSLGIIRMCKSGKNEYCNEKVYI